MRDEMKLRAFLAVLWTEEAQPAPADEGWRELIARIGRPGRTEQVSEEVYRLFLEALPPHYHGGDFFAFCEGAEALKLFARRGSAFVTRQLTWEETVSFCELAGIDLPD